MRVLWFQDVDPMIAPGGAELNDRAMIAAGIRRGHDISVIVPEVLGVPADHADLAVMSNSMEIGTGTYDALIKDGTPYVIFAHDYGPWVCKWRLFYPMEERCADLCYLRDRWRPYLAQAKAIVTLSPLHSWAWLYAYPEFRGKIHEVPSAVPEALFKDLHGLRAGACAVHSGEAFKGWPLVRDWATAHPGTKLTIIGRVPSDAPPNVVPHDSVPYDKMNEFYNQFESFVHLPDRPMPFDRTVAEAYLAGCRVIGNANVGALTWPEFGRREEEVRARLRLAPLMFWEAIE